MCTCPFSQGRSQGGPLRAAGRSAAGPAVAGLVPILAVSGHPGDIAQSHSTAVSTNHESLCSGPAGMGEARGPFLQGRGEQGAAGQE